MTFVSLLDLDSLMLAARKEATIFLSPSPPAKLLGFIPDPKNRSDFKIEQRAWVDLNL